MSNQYTIGVDLSSSNLMIACGGCVFQAKTDTQMRDHIRKEHPTA